MNTSNKKYIKKIGQLVVYLLVFYFIARIIYKNWHEIGNTTENINYGWLLLSLAIITLSITFQSYIWHRLLKHSQNKLRFKESFITYFKSIITRYLPGGIWVFFARTYITTKIGFTKSQILFLIAIESALSVLSGSLVFLIIQPNTDYNFYINILLFILIVASIVFLATPKYFVDLFKSIFKKELAIVPLTASSIILITFLYLIQWFIIGLGIFCLSQALVPLEANQLLPLISIFAISWTIGFIVLFTPSGLGVREAFLIILLSSIVAVPQAVIIALLSRIIFIIGELINFLASTIIKPTPPMQRKEDQNLPKSTSEK